MAQTFLSQLDWRFATKQFDAKKQVSEVDLGRVLEAVRMAPTSFGLQPFQVLVVTDEALRAKLREASWGQSQVTDASHLLVFCARTDITAHIERYIDLIAGGDAETKAGLESFKGMMTQTVGALDATAGLNWSAKQAYIALGFALAACAELSIDSCAMEGFSGEAYDQLLGLEDHLKSVVLLPIGYRAAEPERPKVRFSLEDVVRRV